VRRRQSSRRRPGRTRFDRERPGRAPHAVAGAEFRVCVDEKALRVGDEPEASLAQAAAMAPDARPVGSGGPPTRVSNAAADVISSVTCHDMRGTAGDYEVGPGDEVSTRVPDRHDSDLTARSQTVRDRLGDCVRVAEEDS